MSAVASPNYLWARNPQWFRAPPSPVERTNYARVFGRFCWCDENAQARNRTTLRDPSNIHAGLGGEGKLFLERTTAPR